MIVKNEEEILARCLEPLLKIADEIIIVDTGSSDKTKEVAQKYTDKIYDFDWIGDFAAARNYSLSKASCDYIYTADADEVLDEKNTELFLQLKNALMPEIEIVEMAYANHTEFNTTANFEIEYRPKLFRRLRRFEFADPIHETLRTDPIVYRSNIVIRHCPTSDHSGRDLAVFASMVEGEQHFSSRLEMMYARELMLAGTEQDFNNARPYFEKVMQGEAGAEQSQRRAACVLAKLASLEQNAEALLNYAAPELIGHPPAEICCALGDYFFGKGSIRRAADWYMAALSGAEPEIIASSVGSEPMLGLAECYEAAGDKEKAEQYRIEADAWHETVWNQQQL